MIFYFFYKGLENFLHTLYKKKKKKRNTKLSTSHNIQVSKSTGNWHVPTFSVNFAKQFTWNVDKCNAESSLLMGNMLTLFCISIYFLLIIIQWNKANKTWTNGKKLYIMAWRVVSKWLLSKCQLLGNRNRMCPSSRTLFSLADDSKNAAFQESASDFPVL